MERRVCVCVSVFMEAFAYVEGMKMCCHGSLLGLK